MSANGQTPTPNELHRRQERLSENVHEHSRRISELEKGYARLETKLDGLTNKVDKHSGDSEKEMQSLDSKMDRILNSFPSDRFEQLWGGVKLIGFILAILGAFSAAIVMVFL